jgi:hypothetical protein
MSAANSYRAVEAGYTLEWHDTPQLWVAYRYCGCVDCPKGFGKTQEEAIANLYEYSATPRSEA